MREFIESVLSKELLNQVKNFKKGLYGSNINYGVLAVEKNGKYTDGIEDSLGSIDFIDGIKKLIESGANPFYINPENKKLLIDEVLQDFFNIPDDEMEKIRSLLIDKITNQEIESLHSKFNNELLMTVIYGNEKYKKIFFNKGLKYKQNFELSDEPIEIDLIKNANYDFIKKVLENDENSLDFNKRYISYGKEEFSLKELINKKVNEKKDKIEKMENSLVTLKENVNIYDSKIEQNKIYQEITLISYDLEKYEEQLMFFNRYILKNELSSELKNTKDSKKIKI